MEAAVPLPAVSFIANDGHVGWVGGGESRWSFLCASKRSFVCPEEITKTATWPMGELVGIVSNGALDRKFCTTRITHRRLNAHFDENHTQLTISTRAPSNMKLGKLSSTMLSC